MKYTEEQEAAISDCLDFIHDKLDPRPHFTLTGSPGTGKTVSVRGILEKCQGYNIAAVTVSHVAKNILAENLHGLNVQPLTIAKLVGAIPNMNKSRNDVQFTINKNLSRIHLFDIVVVDECSMIDAFHYKALMNNKRPHTKLIFVGDKNQLPPVEGQGVDSLTLATIDAQLNKVMRFKGPIAEIVEEAKRQIELASAGKHSNPHFINTMFGATGRESKMTESTGYIFLNKNMQMFDLFIQEYLQDPDNINNTRILLFRNDFVTLANEVIRKKLYGENNLSQFELGELIVSNGGFRHGKIPVIHNRETYKVRKITDDIMIGNVACISLVLEPKPHAQHPIITPSIARGGMAQFHKNLKKLADQCKQTGFWKPYHAYKGKFSWWDYTYAQNLYLAQGKTYNSVFVVESEIQDVKPLQLKQKLQALYVGLSRAKERLYIYNKKYKADGTTYINRESFTELFNN